jgi:hypothetical protein
MEVAIATVFYERLLRYPKEWRVVTAYDSSLTADWLLGYADAIAQGRRVWSVPVLRNRIKHLDVVHKLLIRQLTLLIRSVKNWGRHVVDSSTSAQLMAPLLEAQEAIKAGNLPRAWRLVAESRGYVDLLQKKFAQQTSPLTPAVQYPIWRFEEMVYRLQWLHTERKESEQWVAERSPEGEKRRHELHQLVEKLLQVVETATDLSARIRQAYTRLSAEEYLLQHPLKLSVIGFGLLPAAVTAPWANTTTPAD